MKFVKQIVIIVVSCFVLQQFLPWWAIAIGAAVGGYWMGGNGFVSFAAGFLGVALLWIGMALFIDLAASSILSQKVGKILPLNPLLLTALVGGLMGGFSSLTGTLLSAVVKPKNSYR